MLFDQNLGYCHDRYQAVPISIGRPEKRFQKHSLLLSYLIGGLQVDVSSENWATVTGTVWTKIDFLDTHCTTAHKLNLGKSCSIVSYIWKLKDDGSSTHSFQISACRIFNSGKVTKFDAWVHFKIAKWRHVGWGNFFSFHLKEHFHFHVVEDGKFHMNRSPGNIMTGCRVQFSPTCTRPCTVPLSLFSDSTKTFNQLLIPPEYA